MAVALIGLDQISLVLISIIAVASFFWLTAYIFRDMVFMARLFDHFMPIHWVPSGIWNSMWKHEFMRRHRGRRRCAQSNVSERDYEMGPWSEIILAIYVDGRTFDRTIDKRPPILTLAWLEKLRRQKVTGLLVKVNDDEKKHISFMGKGCKPIEVDGAPSVGAGLKIWAENQNLKVRKVGSNRTRPVEGDRRDTPLSSKNLPVGRGRDPLEPVTRTDS